MKITFDHTAFCIQPYGGISRYFAEIAIALDALQHDVSIIAPIHRNVHARELPKRLVHGIGINHFPHYTDRLFTMFNQIVSRSYISCRRPQILHETYYNKNSTFLNKTPTVITIHDMIHELFPQQFRAHDCIPKLKKMAVERADRIICVSENTRNDLVEVLNPEESKIVVVRHGFTPFDDTNQETFQSRDRPYILFVGSRGGYKNFNTLVRAVVASQRLLEDFDIVAFGGGPLSIEELHFIADLGVPEDQIKQRSGDDTALRQMYRNAAALVYPSLYEGFGLPPLEAMANDCPVISSNRSSMPEIVGQAGHFFNPENIEEVCHCIEEVVYSDDLSDDLVRRGRKQIRRYSWERCAKETADVYSSMVSK